MSTGDITGIAFPKQIPLSMSMSGQAMLPQSQGPSIPLPKNCRICLTKTTRIAGTKGFPRTSRGTHICDSKGPGRITLIRVVTRTTRKEHPVLHYRPNCPQTTKAMSLFSRVEILCILITREISAVTRKSAVAHLQVEIRIEKGRATKTQRADTKIGSGAKLRTRKRRTGHPTKIERGGKMQKEVQRYILQPSQTLTIVKDTFTQPSSLSHPKSTLCRNKTLLDTYEDHLAIQRANMERRRRAYVPPFIPEPDAIEDASAEGAEVGQNVLG